VLKDKHDDLSSTETYRGITLTSVMSKLKKTVLLHLYGEFLSSNTLQFGF